VVAEDNEGHAILIRRNLKRGKVDYPIIHVRDGEEAMNFFTGEGTGPHLEKGMRYILLLDISMPKMSGVEVLKKLKKNNELNWIPVIMVTTTDNPKEMERCYSLGCVNYIRKHIDYDQFSTEIRQLGSYILDLDFPTPT